MNSQFVLQLDSDQESTDGEAEAAQGGEPMALLDANRLLFRAARVHNVPLMCQAIGKDDTKPSIKLSKIMYHYSQGFLRFISVHCLPAV